MPAALAVLCLLLALVQRPGQDVADTKVHLFVDPAEFLRDVLSGWTPTGDLGHVSAGQYGGFIFPMGPWFAGGDAAGLPSWLVHRLWLAAVLFAAAWGVVALLRAMWRPVAGPAHVAAAVLFVVNPYVAVSANGTSIALLAYAALPWLLLCVHRGLEDPRGWRWPATFALVLACAGGGVDAAGTGWVLVAPALLVAWWWWQGHGGDVGPFLLRLAPVTLLASAGWVVAVLVRARYGPESLPFPEQFAGDGSVLPSNEAVVVAGLLVPALVLAALRWTLPERPAPFLLVLVLLELVVMAAGWPEGTPLGRALTPTDPHPDAVQLLRTTDEAGPLVALGIACLGGLAWAALPWRGAGSLAVGLVVLAAWPLVTGRALERQLAFELPQAWRDVAARLDARGDDTRALMVPGQHVGFHTWGGTIDPILPAITRDRPVATRSTVPSADLRSVDVQWSVDALLTQRRAVPGQLAPLLDLMGVGDVVVAGDLDPSRGGGLARVGEFSAPRPGQLATITPTGTRGILRVVPRGAATVVDGGAGALTGLAAFGGLQPDRPIVHAADASPEELRRAARVVVSDTNRRQAFVAARPRGAAGRVLGPGEDVPEDGWVLDPFGRVDAQTVQQIRGVRVLRSPFSPQVRQFPEHRPAAAFDGDPRTSWLADRALARDQHWLEVVFEAPRDVPSIELVPYSDARGTVTAVEVAGRRFAVRRGVNRLALGLRRVERLRIRIAEVRRPRRASAGAGGIRELRIPGLRVEELLRPPVLAERALAGEDLGATALTYLFSRWTADDPFLRGRLVGEQSAGDPRDVQDPEGRIARTFSPPEPRRWVASGWVHPDPLRGDAALDRLAGTSGPIVASGSSRFEGRPRWRASSAFDGRMGRPWIAQWIRGRPAWLRWTGERRMRVRRLRLDPVRGMRVRAPAEIRLTVDGRRGPRVRVREDGLAVLPRAVRGRAFRLDVLAVRGGGRPWRRAVGVAELRAPGVPRLAVPRRGVLRAPCGSAEVALAAAPAAAAGGARAARARARAGGAAVPARAARGDSSDVRALAAGRTLAVPMRVRADLRAFDAGRPLRAEGCGTVRLPAGPVDLRGVDRPLVVDHLRLEGAPRLFAATAAGGRVVLPGDGGNGRRTDAQVVADGPSWLVLGETTNPGWRARCDGTDLGPPRTLQGYANAWPIDAPGCDDVDLVWAPNGLVRASLVVSALTCAVLLGLLLLAARRRRRAGVPAAAASPAGPARLAIADPGPRPLRRALATGVAASLAIALLFGLRAGAVAGPLVALVLWRGVTWRPLVLLAGALLVVAVPAVLLLAGPTDRGGFPRDVAGAHLAAHWIALAAWVMLAIGAARALSAARRASAP